MDLESHSVQRRTSFGEKLAPISADRAAPVLRASYYEESDIHHDLTVTLLLPDGRHEVFALKDGETVSELKRKLVTTRNYPHPFADTQLYLNGKFMMDPLSLNDFPAIVGKSEISLEVRIKDSTASVVSADRRSQAELDGAGKIPGSVNSPSGGSGSASLSPNTGTVNGPSRLADAPSSPSAPAASEPSSARRVTPSTNAVDAAPPSSSRPAPSSAPPKRKACCSIL
eukprot:TRINITY_DN9939_c0_g1_i1.p1 TRINITY_DN9939_c0_g1~~TRINITY_DN9939_c0_g1_i1.p1  ORF type:complete len:227 (-),score=33.71 TRINITY_DN9939_c0_g1_i1:235-915(-)